MENIKVCLTSSSSYTYDNGTKNFIQINRDYIFVPSLKGFWKMIGSNNGNNFLNRERKNGP